MGFRKCTQCGREWADREGFLADPAVALSGCQVDTDRPRGSALLFDHKTKDCGTTIAVGIGAFSDLYAGPVHKVNWAPSAKCPRKCFDPKNLDACPAQCASAFVREVLQVIRRASATKRP
jgi:hypothetical protein